MRTDDQDRGPTIDMTLDGEVIAPPSFWSRARALWRALPPGSVPALITLVLLLAAGAIFLVGILIVAIPVVLALAVLGFVIRASMGSPPAGPPARR